MYTQLALDSITLAENMTESPVLPVIRVITLIASILACCGVLFGLALTADAEHARRTGRPRRISPHLDGWPVIVGSATGQALILTAAAIITFSL